MKKSFYRREFNIYCLVLRCDAKIFLQDCLGFHSKVASLPLQSIDFQKY